MADAKNYLAVSMKAGNTNLGGRQHCIVTDVTANKNMVQWATTSSQAPIGVLQDKPTVTGEACEIAVAGVCKIKIRSKVTSMSMIAANASGFGISATTTCAIPVGRALYGGSTNDIIPVLLCVGQATIGPRLGTL